MKNKMNLNRLGIFCFYDREGIVDDYIDYLLHQLCKCINYLIIVINGSVNNDGMIKLSKYADEMHIRENKGFDGGAYRDIIVNVLCINRLQMYDELVLCNDTFFGPFVPLESIFNDMENKEVDFWGLNYSYNNIQNHLQSYFLVFRKKIIDDPRFFNYFRDNINALTEDIRDIYSDFETGLFYYLIFHKYLYGVYAKDNPFNIYQASNLCIKECNVPIMKKVAFSPKWFIRNNILDSLNYLYRNNLYNLDLILKNVKRVYCLEFNKLEIEKFNPGVRDIKRVEYDVSKINISDIYKYFLTDKKLYIYGLGSYSKRISKIIEIYNGRIEGYIVSDNQINNPDYNNKLKVYKLSELTNALNIVIIVALDKSHTNEVKSYLKEFNEVLFLW